MQCLWDTNTLSEYLRGKNPVVAAKAAAYRSQFGRFAFSLVTYYEVLRGLKARNLTGRLAQFAAICQGHTIVELNRDVMNFAADLWADLTRKGQIIEDNDILIAATALHHGLALATGNVAHFSRIPNLTLEDWTQP